MGNPGAFDWCATHGPTPRRPASESVCLALILDKTDRVPDIMRVADLPTQGNLLD